MYILWTQVLYQSDAVCPPAHDWALHVLDSVFSWTKLLNWDKVWFTGFLWLCVLSYLEKLHLIQVQWGISYILCSGFLCFSSSIENYDLFQGAVRGKCEVNIEVYFHWYLNFFFFFLECAEKTTFFPLNYFGTSAKNESTTREEHILGPCSDPLCMWPPFYKHHFILKISKL